jgi:hypothetical protein
VVGQSRLRLFSHLMRRDLTDGVVIIIIIIIIRFITHVKSFT